MSESTTNHICRTCGRSYYACPDCDKLGSWRAVACSTECYRKYMDAVLEVRTSKPSSNEPPQVHDEDFHEITLQTQTKKNKVK